MIDNNLPPGCRLSDLPGWNDEDVEVSVVCEKCDEQYDDTVTVDGDGCDVESTCPECSHVNAFTWRAPEPDYDDWEPDYPAQDHPYF